MRVSSVDVWYFFFFQAEDGIRDLTVTGVQTCALPISRTAPATRAARAPAGCRPACAARPRSASRWRARARGPPARRARDTPRGARQRAPGGGATHTTRTPARGGDETPPR